jgi:hypothetical protein
MKSDGVDRLLKILAKDPVHLSRRDRRYLAELRLRQQETEQFGAEEAELRAQDRRVELLSSRAERRAQTLLNKQRSAVATERNKRAAEIEAGRRMGEAMLPLSQHERDLWNKPRPSDDDAIYHRLPGSFESGR